jgi:hypothetical protein
MVSAARLCEARKRRFPPPDDLNPTIIFDRVPGQQDRFTFVAPTSASSIGESTLELLMFLRLLNSREVRPIIQSKGYGLWDYHSRHYVELLRNGRLPSVGRG